MFVIISPINPNNMNCIPMIINNIAIVNNGCLKATPAKRRSIKSRAKIEPIEKKKPPIAPNK